MSGEARTSARGGNSPAPPHTRDAGVLLALRNATTIIPQEPGGTRGHVPQSYPHPPPPQDMASTYDGDSIVKCSKVSSAPRMRLKAEIEAKYNLAPQHLDNHAVAFYWTRSIVATHPDRVWECCTFGCRGKGLRG